MTVEQALKARIPRVRMKQWANPNSYLRLPLLANGLHGPWAELYDDPVQKDVLEIRPGSQRLPMTKPLLSAEIEPYVGPVSEFEQHKSNFARQYTEA